MFIQQLHNALTITGFVLVMMLMIEYLNIRSRGQWLSGIRKTRIGQVVFGTLIGLIPGCLGSFFMVSLFTHGSISLGALVATMIATAGDEAFFMFSIIPVQAMILHGILLVIAIGSGILVDIIWKKYRYKKPHMNFEIHEHDALNVFTGISIKENLKNISFQRAFILFGLLLIMLNTVAGFSGHEDDHHEEAANHAFEIEGMLNYLFAGLSLITFFIILKVPEHFISEHLWGHVIKKHFLKLFLWTFGAIMLIEFGLPYIHAEDWLSDNMIWVLLLAVIIGIIPESGPHMVFVTLFAGGLIPFSILIASSIVQDGHGGLPLLAESQRSFLIVKGINIVIGLLAGLTGLWLGF